jgi:hypothetical protein
MYGRMRRSMLVLREFVLVRSYPSYMEGYVIKYGLMQVIPLTLPLCFL